MRGKTYLGDLVPFGEQVLMKDIDRIEAGKLNPRWRKGVFVGKLDFTDEFMIKTTPWSFLLKSEVHLGSLELHTVRPQ
eukprot:1721069-Amphidinium_carterae.1